MMVIYGICIAGASVPQGPAQPPDGPGGSDYYHRSFRQTRYGDYEDKLFIFEPQDPQPASAPVAIIFHGLFASDPNYYIGWIEHLCRKGWIVVFPCYQGTGELPSQYTTNSIRSVRDAFAILYDRKQTEPDRDRVAFIGHECGAVIAANIAATATYYRLPQPSSLFLLMPTLMDGITETGKMDIYNLSGIPEGTHMLVSIGDEVPEETDRLARELFYRADRVRSADKNFIIFLTDTHGSPPLIADLNSPLTPREPVYVRAVERRRHDYIMLFKNRELARHIRCRGIDSMDWFGTFKLFDAMTDAAFYGGRNRKYAFGDTPEQRFMGYWSDYKPVNGLLSSDRP